MILKGKAHLYGDNIDTDRIIAGKYTKTLDFQNLAKHVLEDLDPKFRKKMKKGDFIVAGYNFGCGSSREQAPLALQLSGVGAVIAKSFARIFYRNAINIGLPLIEIKNHNFETGDRLEVNIGSGEVRNVNSGKIQQGLEMPEVMVDILAEGGLIPYLKKHKSFS